MKKYLDLFCIASGPSLTKADCDLVARSGAKILAVNNSWQMFDKIDYLYAGDLKWWKAYSGKTTVSVGEKWSCSAAAAKQFGLNLHRVSRSPFNSGMRALQWAIGQGFKNIGLLGYDCSLVGGSHWHGQHTFQHAYPVTQQKVNKWHLQFAKVAQQAKRAGVTITNFSRHTELGCFPVAALEDLLWC
jgi:hypothetical protein